MTTFTQNFTAVADNLALSAVVALIPILYFFWALAIKGMKGHIAGLTTLLVAIITAVIAFKMPTGMAVMSATQGGIFGILPIGWIIITSVFLYKLTVKTGQFDVIRSSVLSITEDRRIQVLLIAFSFGAFLEGAAGFGAPVAIAAALLIGLGFKPLHAAGLSLIANTAPVAFGAIGIPIIAAEGATGIPALEISKMVGRQLPFLSMFIPLYLVVIMVGFRRAWEIMPAILVSGISFALTQYLSSNFLGPELPDILSAIVSLVAMIILLRFWKPKTIYRFASDKKSETESDRPNAEEKEVVYSAGQILRAWSPFLILTATISVWGIPAIKQALVGTYEGTNIILKGINAIGHSLTLIVEVPGLHNQIIDYVQKPIAAFYKVEFLGAAGTAILIAALISKYIVKISWKKWGLAFIETLNELKYPILTITSVVAFAYVINASGMSTTLGMALAKTGALFPFFSPFLGWLGVFITGSDTSANLLFGSLQKVTATSIGMDPVLAVAANSSGGVTGKMISPQSIAVAAAAVGLAGKESELFRFTIKHSLFLIVLVGIITYLQHTVFSWMIP